MMLAICDEPLARSADLAESDPAERPAYDLAYGGAVGRLSRGIAGIHADPVFQEAVTWQNPGLAQFLHDHDAGPDAARRSKQRQRELVIANYLQRYCLKNDTIGFFGPVGWASADPGAAGLVVRPGEQVIARRSTYFEVWAIDKVAAEIARRGRVLGWLRPRRTRSVFVAGNVLHRPHRGPVTLTGAELRVLAACDGRRTVSEVLGGAGGPGGSAVLARLAGLGALRLDLEGPMHAWPERLLRDKLELIADPAARAAALEPVEAMVRARDAVAAADGDPAGLRRALAGLAETFEQVTGSPATRRAGANYAGRTLVYQDAVRDVRVELGQAVMGALAAPLGLVLDSARWLVNDITDRYRVYFADLLDRESARAGGAPVPLPRLLARASPYLVAGGTGRGVGELAPASVAELQRRWQQVLGPPASGRRHQVSADAISARAAGYFPGRPVAWSGARQHAPDIMIAAASPGEVERGNFLLVLGEIHLATNTLDQRLFVEQHPDPARLIAAEQADRGPRRIVSILEKDHPNVTSRLSPPTAVAGARPALLVLRHRRLARPPGIGHGTARRRDDRHPPRRRPGRPAPAVRHRAGLLRGHRGRDERSRRRRVPAGGSGRAPAADHDRPVRPVPGAVGVPGRGLAAGPSSRTSRNATTSRGAGGPSISCPSGCSTGSRWSSSPRPPTSAASSW